MSRKQPGPTIRRRMLGKQLRGLRESRGYSCEQVGKRLEWSTAKVSRIETARTAAHANDVRLLLDLYEEADQNQIESLIDLTRTPRRTPGWWNSYTDVVPGKQWTFIRLEDDAELIRGFELELVPGILQTAEYARAVLQACRPHDDAKAIDRRVDARIARQELLDRDDMPELWFILGESALQRIPALGEPAASQQFERLLAAVEHPNITIQVLPFTVGLHPGVDGAFTMIRFPDPAGEVAYFENRSWSYYLEDDESLVTYDLLFNHLRAEALDKAQSKRHIETLRESST